MAQVSSPPKKGSLGKMGLFRPFSRDSSEDLEILQKILENLEIVLL